jgi:hypothetical protein
MNNACRLLLGKYVGNRTRERRDSSWEGVLKWIYKRVGLEGVHWVHWTQNKIQWKARQKQQQRLTNIT